MVIATLLQSIFSSKKRWLTTRPRELSLWRARKRREQPAGRALAHAAMAHVCVLWRDVERVAHLAALAATCGDWRFDFAHSAALPPP